MTSTAVVTYSLICIQDGELDGNINAALLSDLSHYLSVMCHSGNILLIACQKKTENPETCVNYTVVKLKHVTIVFPSIDSLGLLGL